MDEKIAGILDFMRVAEKLKTELRHSWTSDTSRRESVAEHSWSSCLLAIVLFDKISIKVNQLRVLKMVVVHDLAEVIVGDIPAFEVSKRKSAKLENEAKAIRKIVKSLKNDRLAGEIVGLWEEFEEDRTAESKLARACDRFDALLQHLNTDINTWEQGDYDQNPYDSQYKFDFDKFIRGLKDRLDVDVMESIEAAGALDRISPEAREQWAKHKKD